MTEFSEYSPGTFCWVELATPDADGATAFYTELFGWGTRDIPSWDTQTQEMDGSLYTTFMNDERPAA